VPTRDAPVGTLRQGGCHACSHDSDDGTGGGAVGCHAGHPERTSRVAVGCASFKLVSLTLGVFVGKRLFVGPRQCKHASQKAMWSHDQEAE
jgi:hypothetical protein